MASNIDQSVVSQRSSKRPEPLNIEIDDTDYVSLIEDLSFPETGTRSSEMSWKIGYSCIGVLLTVLRNAILKMTENNAFEKSLKNSLAKRSFNMLEQYSKFYRDNISIGATEKKPEEGSDQDLNKMLWDFITQKPVTAHMVKKSREEGKLYEPDHTISDAVKSIRSIASAIECRIHDLHSRMLQDGSISWTDKKFNNRSSEWMKTSLAPFLSTMLQESKSFFDHSVQMIRNAQIKSIEEKKEKGIERKHPQAFFGHYQAPIAYAPQGVHQGSFMQTPQGSFMQAPQSSFIQTPHGTFPVVQTSNGPRVYVPFVHQPQQATVHSYYRRPESHQRHSKE